MADKKASETSKASKAEQDSVAVPPRKSGGNNKTLVIVLILVFVVFVLPGFVIAGSFWWWGRGNNASKLTESIIENATGGKVDVDSKSGDYTVKSSDGTYELTSSGKLPENFPDEVPLYGDQDITGSYRSSNDNASSWSVVAETKDSVSRVDDFFDEEFSSWDNQGEYASNDTTTTIYKKGNLSVTVSVGPKTNDAGKTSISYLASEDTAN